MEDDYRGPDTHSTPTFKLPVISGEVPHASAFLCHDTSRANQDMTGRTIVLPQHPTTFTSGKSAYTTSHEENV